MEARARRRYPRRWHVLQHANDQIEFSRTPALERDRRSRDDLSSFTLQMQICAISPSLPALGFSYTQDELGHEVDRFIARTKRRDNL